MCAIQDVLAFCSSRPAQAGCGSLQLAEAGDWLPPARNCISLLRSDPTVFVATRVQNRHAKTIANICPRRGELDHVQINHNQLWCATEIDGIGVV
jgi:hypothetical protein